jgi:hypothetical protein
VSKAIEHNKASVFPNTTTTTTTTHTTTTITLKPNLFVPQHNLPLQM